MTDMTAPQAPQAPPGAIRAWGRAAGIAGARLAAAGVAKAREWHLRAAVPALAGMTLVSAGLGMKLGAWAGVLAAGVFLLRIDSRL